MSKINYGRVVLGGIVAGIIIDAFEFVLNGIILGPQWPALMQSINRPALGLHEIMIFNVMGLAMGLASVWTYAAIRPRFGAGVMTAVYAGVLLWFVGNLIANGFIHVMGVYPMNMYVAMVGIGLVESVAATIAGAFLYKES